MFLVDDALHGGIEISERLARKPQAFGLGENNPVSDRRGLPDDWWYRRPRTADDDDEREKNYLEETVSSHRAAPSKQLQLPSRYRPAAPAGSSSGSPICARASNRRPPTSQEAST